jgi:hypothetical protein
MKDVKNIKNPSFGNFAIKGGAFSICRKRFGNGENSTHLVTYQQQNDLDLIN